MAKYIVSKQITALPLCDILCLEQQTVSHRAVLNTD